MKTDSATDLVATRLAQAVRNYIRPRPTKFQKLLPLKQSIAELRSKGASYAAIAEILCNVNVHVASDTIFRFCHEILHEPRSRRRKRRKEEAQDSRKRVREEPHESHPSSTVRKGEDQPLQTWQRSDGPRIADPNDI